MTIAVAILAILVVAQQFFNAAMLRAVVVDRSEVAKLADSVSELADATLDLAARVLSKKKAKAPERKPNAKGEVLYKGSYMKKEAADALDKMDKKIAAAERKKAKGGKK